MSLGVSRFRLSSNRLTVKVIYVRHFWGKIDVGGDKGIGCVCLAEVRMRADYATNKIKVVGNELIGW